MLKLIKILKFFKIKNKSFDIVINNVSNNNTSKDELEKALN